MEIKEHIGALEREGRLLVDAARSTELTTPVPSCPGWLMRDLLAHIGFVHRWATSYVANGITEMVDRPDEAGVLVAAPSDEDLCTWVEDGHGALVRALSDAPFDLRCWTFLKAPSALAMWARRQAHETAVHRVDAELAAGRGPSAIEPAFAADGIDELLVGFFGRSASSESGDPVGRLGLVAIDRPETWTVRVFEHRVVAESGLAECDLVFRAPAADLYLLMWNRRSLSGLDAAGRTELFDRWRDRFSVRWS